MSRPQLMTSYAHLDEVQGQPARPRRAGTDFQTLRSVGAPVRAWRLSDHFPLWCLDVGAVLEQAYGMSYAERCAFIARERGRPRLLTGQVSTSRGVDFGDHNVYTVVLSDGSVVADHLPWLMRLYRGAFLRLVNDLVSPVTGYEYHTSIDPVSAVNLNLLTPGERYEWHVDSNPLTALLFCPTGDDGSELVFASQPGAEGPAWSRAVHARWGHMLVFDAREVPHSVHNVTVDRITVPMNFHVDPHRSERPPDIDCYLYG